MLISNVYGIAGKFRGWLIFYHFTGLISLMLALTQYVLYNRAYFTGLNFAVRHSSAKTTKIGPLENLSLYSMSAMASSSLKAGIFLASPRLIHVLVCTPAVMDLLNLSAI